MRDETHKEVILIFIDNLEISKECHYYFCNYLKERRAAKLRSDLSVLQHWYSL